MTDNTNHSKRIVKNTLYLYLRMAFLMVISIFTSRVLLEKLGIDNYGIYNVVGGVAVLFSFFSSSLTNASQRFLSIELGRHDLKKANAIFNQHLILYSLVVAGTILLAETVGLWFVYTQLNIPDQRVFAAVCVYHFTVASLCLTLIGIVFNSCVIAHEAMNVFSYIGIFEGVAKLGIVYLLSISSMDKLILYGCLMFVVTLVVQLCYMVHCFRYYAECRLKWIWDKIILRETTAVVGWNMLGTAVYAVNDSGVNILMNLFGGPTVNAARALSYQVSGAVGNFSNNFFTSVRPQLMKSYAAGDYEYMMKLFYGSSKYSYYLLWIICLPVMLAINELLAIWLVDVPHYVAVFTIWILIYSMINSLNNPIWAIALAVGRMKRYILIGSGVFLLIFPISYMVLKLDYPPYSVFVVMVLVRSMYLYVVLRIIKHYIPVTANEYLDKVVWPIIKSMVLSVAVVVPLYDVMPRHVAGTLLFCVLAALLTTLCVAWIGVTAAERVVLWNFVKYKIRIKK